MSTRESYDVFLKQLSDVTGLAGLQADAEGLLSLSVEETYTLNLQLIEARSKILCFIELLDLPDDTPAAVYRDLLVGTLFGQDTGGGWFSVEPENNTVIFNCMLDFDADTDAGEFAAMLERILSLADIWVRRLRQLPAGTERPSATAEIHP